jgi:hypothetical protein
MHGQKNIKKHILELFQLQNPNILNLHVVYFIYTSVTF